MSTRSTLIVICATVLSLGTALWTTQHISKNNPSASKRDVLRFSNEPIPRTHKLQAAFQIELSSDQPTPLPENQVFQLTAEIRTDSPANGLTFRWVIPPGVEPLDPVTTGSLGNLSVKETQTVRRMFRNLTVENQVVGLVVTDSAAIATSAQFHTANQDALRTEMAEIEKRNAEYIKQNPDVIKKYK